jgi:hypothetical protein
MFQTRPTVDKRKKRRKLSGESSSESSAENRGSPEAIAPIHQKMKKTKGNIAPQSEKDSVVYSVDEITEKDHGLIESHGKKEIGLRIPISGFGPVRSAAGSRSTSRFDYQMDICKDYKETGYCGFGDSCIFLHDRSDFKSGWEIEKEWNEKQQKLHNATKSGGNSNERSHDFSTTCALCLRGWKDCETPPCVTKCGHYFCEGCFMQKSSIKCSSCGKPTQGIFDALDTK